MHIVKVDDRGRLLLKKAIIKLPEYYKLDFAPNGKLLLTPIIDQEEVKSLNKEEHE